MNEERKKELQSLLQQNLERQQQAKAEKDRETATVEAGRRRFEELAKKVIEPVLREFEQTVRGTEFLTEVKYEQRSNGYDRIYLYIHPRGGTSERFPENRKMAIFTGNPHKGKVSFFDNSISNLGGEHHADAELESENLTSAKVEELVFNYVKNALAGKIR
jgi:hypothetical protein